MLSQYFIMLLNLFFMISLMGALYLLAKKLKLARYGNEKFVKILQVLPIGSKEKIVLLEANNSVILIGVTANHIETLHVVENAVENRNNEQIDHPSFLQAISGENQVKRHE